MIIALTVNKTWYDFNWRSFFTVILSVDKYSTRLLISPAEFNWVEARQIRSQTHCDIDVFNFMISVNACLENWLSLIEFGTLICYFYSFIPSVKVLSFNAFIFIVYLGIKWNSCKSLYVIVLWLFGNMFCFKTTCFLQNVILFYRTYFEGRFWMFCYRDFSCSSIKTAK